MSMNKAEQIQYIAFNGGLIKSESERAIKLVGEMVKTALSDENGKPVVGAKLKIDGLGTFSVVATKARTGDNPLYLAAQKAAEAGNADEKQLQLLKAVKEGLASATYEKPAGTAIKFKAEAALKLWAGGGDDEADEADASGEVIPDDGSANAPAVEGGTQDVGEVNSQS